MRTVLSAFKQKNLLVSSKIDCLFNKHAVSVCQAHFVHPIGILTVKEAKVIKAFELFSVELNPNEKRNRKINNLSKREGGSLC